MNIDTLQNLDGHAFEGVVAGLLKAMGLRTERSKLSADGGIDVIAYCDEPLLRGKYIIQCKRQMAPVGEPVLRDLYGTMMSERAAKGILITTSRFTQSAHSFAQDKPMELISGNELIGLLRKKGLLDVVDTRGTSIPPQVEHLIHELNRMLCPILGEIDDIERGHVPLERDADPQRYVREVSRTVASLSPTVESIVNIYNDLSRAANEGRLEPVEMTRKLKLMAKHVRAIKDLWVSSRQMRQPDRLAEPLQKMWVGVTHRALLSACRLPEILQGYIDSVREGEPTSTTVVFDFSRDIASIDKQLGYLKRRLERRQQIDKGGSGCSSVLVLLLISVVIVLSIGCCLGSWWAAR